MKHWYAIHVLSNHEQLVQSALQFHAIEEFFPSYAVEKRIRPLFPGYTFARFERPERSRVLQIPGVLKLLGNPLGPIPIPDQEIESIRAIEAVTPLQPEPYTSGQKIRVLRGPLTGLEGTITRRKGQARLVVSIDLLRRSVSAELDASWLEPIPKAA